MLKTNVWEKNIESSQRENSDHMHGEIMKSNS